MRSRVFGSIVALIALLVSFVPVQAARPAPFQDRQIVNPIGPTGVPIVGLTSANELVTFDATTPGTVVTTVAVSGLALGQTLVGIDYRPATGQLYGLAIVPGISFQLYTLNLASGAATAVGGSTTSLGTVYAFDFNPVADRIRVVNNLGENLSVNPNDGVVTPQTVINPGGVSIPAVAYTQNIAGAIATTLYGIDSTGDQLGTIAPPASGAFTAVGPLGVDTNDQIAFDIAPGTGMAYASLTVGGVDGLYTINLASGAATLVGAFATTNPILGLSVLPYGTFNFSTSSFSVNENAGTATVTVTRTGAAADTAANVTYATSNGSAQSADYTPASGTLVFAIGEFTKTFTVTIANDAIIEDVETVNLTLSAPSGSAALGTRSTATLVIADDEAPPSVLVATTMTNTLVTFSSAAPATILSSAAISGLQPGETLAGIDFRPVDNQLYGLGTTGRLYTITVASGLATQVLTATTTLSGTSFGFDFNPAADRIRVTSNTGQNLRLNPNTGGLAATDPDLNPAPQPITGVAYTNSVSGATVTTLYGINPISGTLVRIGGPGGTPSPNGGAVTGIGPLGVVPVTNTVGFDIAPYSGAAFASLVVTGTTSAGNASQLYTVDVVSGTASLIGPIGGAGLMVTGLAVVPPAGTFRFASTASFFVEGAGTVTIPVLRMMGTEGTVTIPYTTTNGTAIAGQDYVTSTGTLTFTNTMTRADISLQILEDTTIEGNEFFLVSLGTPSRGTLGSPATTMIFIIDNDVPPPSDRTIYIPVAVNQRNILNP